MLLLSLSLPLFHCCLYWRLTINIIVLSRGQDDLAQLFLQREQRDACGFNGQLKVRSDNFQIVGMKATSTGTCNFAVTGAKAATTTQITSETYGPDTTLWLSIPPHLSFYLSYFPSHLLCNYLFDLKQTFPLQNLSMSPLLYLFKCKATHLKKKKKKREERKKKKKKKILIKGQFIFM